MSVVNENINNNFFSFLSCVMARLAYLKMPEVFQKYTLIMDTIPDKMINSIKQLKNEDNIFNDETIFSNMEQQYFKQIDEDKFIGFHRLAINGLSEKGDQPFEYNTENGYSSGVVYRKSTRRNRSDEGIFVITNDFVGPRERTSIIIL